MRLIFLSLGFLFVLSSCDNANKNTSKTSEKVVYDMYEPSEMANLMNQMYAYNLEIKKTIVKGDMLAEFPLDFLKIHTAELSDFKQRNETFKSFSKLFIDTEKEIFNADSQVAIKERFNNAINVCISCHQTECTGPIPRIRKLLIK